MSTNEISINLDWMQKQFFYSLAHANEPITEPCHQICIQCKFIPRNRIKNKICPICNHKLYEPKSVEKYMEAMEVFVDNGKKELEILFGENI